VLLVISGLINYIDRTTLSVGATDIQRELGINYEHIGMLHSAFFFVYAAAQLFSLAGWLTDRFFQSRRAPVCAILLLGVGSLTLVYRVAVGVGALPTVICLALTGFCLYGAQILLVGTAAQDFARRGAAAGAAGLVDFTGHLGAFTGDVMTGWTLKHYGWPGSIAWWACAAFGAALLVATLWRARPSAEAPAGSR